MKICKICGGNDYYKSGHCRPCTISKVSKWKKENPDKVKASIEKNKHKQFFIQKTYREKNKDKLKEKDLKWRQKNKDSISENRRERYKKNKEIEKAQMKAWRMSNPEKCKELQLKWQEKNKEKYQEYCRVYCRNRRAKRKLIGGKHTAEDIKNLLIFQNGKCICCKKSIKEKYHVDHIIPFAKGGTNDKYNLQLLCPSCNQRKHAKDPIQFMQSLGYLL